MFVCGLQTRPTDLRLQLILLCTFNCATATFMQSAICVEQRGSIWEEDGWRLSQCRPGSGKPGDSPATKGSTLDRSRSRSRWTKCFGWPNSLEKIKYRLHLHGLLMPGEEPAPEQPQNPGYMPPKTWKQSRTKLKHLEPLIICPHWWATAGGTSERQGVVQLIKDQKRSILVNHLIGKQVF